MPFRGPKTRIQATLSALVLACSLAGVGGCEYQEHYKFESTPLEPKTVMVIDSATGETVWTCDVPVGERLDIQFKNRPERARELGYDEMTYGLAGADERSAGRRSSVKVPPPPTRRITWVPRPAPEAYPTSK